MFFFGAILVLIAVGIVSLVVVSSSTYLNRSKQDCTHTGQNHLATIQHNNVTPAATIGSACDTLTIVNHDNIERLIAFGVHEAHVPYNGVAEKILKKDQSFTITLDQLGNFRFHDHIHDEVQGTFTVTNN